MDKSEPVKLVPKNFPLFKLDLGALIFERSSYPKTNPLFHKVIKLAALI